MRRLKENPRRYVVCIRISDQERDVLEELTRRDCKTISNLMREALQGYLPVWKSRQGRR